MNRRSFLASAARWGVAGFTPARWTVFVRGAHAQQQRPLTLRIAHLSHQTGAHPELASYAVMGAQLGVEEAKVSAGLFGTTVELIIEDAVTRENALAVAGKLTAKHGISAVIGALDDELTSLLSAFTQEQRVVFFNAAARGGSFAA